MKGKKLFMKKSTKIILPALAVLVLGTAAAATGTVAWFASNGVVEATNMNVKCTTAKNLLIANGSADKLDQAGYAYGVTVASKHATVLEIAPCSTTEDSMATGEPEFFKTDSKINAVTGNVVEGTVVSPAVESVNYVKHSFWLMAQSTSDLNLSIKSVSINGATNNNGLNANISQALRMGVFYTDASTTTPTKYSDIFNLGANGDTSYAGFKDEGTLSTVTIDEATHRVSSCKVGDNVVTDEVTPSTYASLTNYSLGKVKATTTAKEISESVWSQIDFYFWYEGQDSHCTANDALNIQALDISISLQATATA